MSALQIVGLIVAIFAPPLVLGCLHKLKAGLQNRIGAPIHQPFLDIIKLLRKGEVVSEHSSMVLHGASAVMLATCLLVTISVPWFGIDNPIFKLDIFTLIYILVLVRFANLLISLDSNSAFGGFGASREALLSILVEPAVMLCLASLAIACKSVDLNQIFSFSDTLLSNHCGLWILAGCGLFLSSLVELSRMPSDDPTTHLELSMVHEAMILENSGPNLAAVNYATAIKLSVLFGLSGQCFLHAFSCMWDFPPVVQVMAGIVAVAAPVVLISVIETTAVRLRWTKLPEFIGYSVGFGLLCLLQSIGSI